MSHVHGGSDTPDNVYLQKVYWAFVGSAIGAATLANAINHVIAYQRHRDPSPTPSTPKSLLSKTIATTTALLREASNATPPPLHLHRYTLHFPPLGPTTLLLSNLTLTTILCFHKLNTYNQWSWETIGYRTGFITIAQLPLLFLLSGRTNILSLLTGTPYTTLLFYHRWCARTLWLTATFHMGFFFRSWARYNYILYQLKNEFYPKRGFAAWILLSAIVVFSARPVRRVSYEVFVLGHLVLFVGFLVALWLHATEEVKGWIWVSVGLVVFDRVVRYVWGAYVNLAVFHRRKKEGHALWMHQASFEALPGGVTRVSIVDPRVRWKVGQSMFLTCHAIAPLQSHPFTISSMPDDGRMEFLIRAEKGGTRRFLRYASKHVGNSGLGEVGGAGAGVVASGGKPRTVFLEGPYGSHRPLSQFDSVVLIAGGMGATFTVPLLRDLVARWKDEHAKEGLQRTVTKRIRFIWVTRSRVHLSWFGDHINSALETVEECRHAAPDTVREMGMSVYITGGEAEQTQAQPSEAYPPDATPSNIDSHNHEKLEQDISSLHSTTSTSIELKTYPNPPTTTGQKQHRRKETTDTEASVYQGPELVQPLHSSTLGIHPGRPQVRPLIRQVLEKAEGESAVVICGPASLSDEVRRSVVYLSDERAVHKGTGAQGIYLHVEGFGW
ncbi:ferric reductase NAD binding domain-containing protein [Aspergillus karnatakaensis]|uniref:ferric reductase family protein n=1 Tax=Aspergillus karnatakaensis TaxID=1810916 RepID=UPI003CCDBBE7